MKILIYSAGVIGGQLCHALCTCGNDVTVIARGSWAEMLSVGSGLLISFMFKGGKEHKKECRETRIDIDRRLKKALAELRVISWSLLRDSPCI